MGLRDRLPPPLPPPPSPPWQERLLLALGLVAVYFFCAQPLWDPDTYWHLAVGREIWTEGHLVHTETFSFTAAGTPWEDTEWLFHLLAYPLWLLGSDRLLMVLTGLAAVGTACLAYRSFRAAGRGSFLWLPVFLILLPSLQTRIRFRPDLLTLLFMGLLVEFLLREEGGVPIGWKKGAALAAFFWLWGQCHGGWAYGLFLLAAAWAGDTLDRWRERPFPLRRVLSRLAAGLASFAVLFLSPDTWRVPWFPFKSLVGFLDPQLAQIAEWSRTPFKAVFWPFFGLSALVLSLLLLQGRKVRWKEVFWAISQIALGWMWNRYVAVAVVALLPLAARLLPAPSLPERAVRLAKGAVLSAALLALSWSYHTRVPGWDLSQKYPVQETAFLRSRGLSGNLFNLYAAGGYLAWEAGPESRIFMDGRYYPFLQPIADYWKGMKDIPSFQGLLKAYPFEIALYPLSDYRLRDRRGIPGSPERGPEVLLFPREEWAPVFYGNYGVVLLRRIPRFQGVIAAEEYRYVSPDDLAYAVWASRKGLWPASEVASEIHRILEANPRLVYREALERALDALPPVGERP